jgi:hypothetical protein
MAEPIGNIYSTGIPSLDDTANIQEALRIYHYGRPSGSDPNTQYNVTYKNYDILSQSIYNTIISNPEAIQQMTKASNTTSSLEQDTIRKDIYN